MIVQHGPNMPLLDQLLAVVLDDPGVVTSTTRGSLYIRAKPLASRGQSYFTRSLTGPVTRIDAIDSSRVLRRMKELIACMGSTPQECDPRFQMYAEQRLRDRPLCVLAGIMVGDRLEQLPARVITAAPDLLLLHSQLVRLMLTCALPDPLQAIETVLADADSRQMAITTFAFDRLIEADVIAIWQNGDAGLNGYASASRISEPGYWDIKQTFGDFVTRNDVVLTNALVTVDRRRQGGFRFLNRAVLDWHRSVFEGKSPAFVHARPVSAHNFICRALESEGYVFRTRRAADTDRGAAFLYTRPNRQRDRPVPAP